MLRDIPSNVGERTAPELYGMFFNYGLMGSLAVQVYHYYSSFPADKKVIKAVVYTLLILEVAQTGIMSYFAYTIFGSGYGNLEVFDKSALEWFPVCILGSVIAGMVQLFYAHRIRLLIGSKLLGSLVAFFALLQIGSGIGQGIISKLAVDRSNLSSKPICVTIWLLSSAVCDLIIAGSMVFWLKRQRFLSVHMHDTVARVVRYTVETGSVTALVAILQVVVFLAFPNNNFFETPSWTLGKLYSNSLLVLLNSRAVILGGRSYQSAPAESINEIRFNSRGDVSTLPLDIRTSSTGSNHAAAIGGVRVQKEVQVAKEDVRWPGGIASPVSREGEV
ncbi:hypothetical protein D9758_005338 [Tetrapyrgos nigripes]|uniref:DUF6534 domain-containing protein n=1 Tax=Tetrapyrgos nigripes TaxID=182062 RepID=A0A8H5GHR5_9AGAR|nr:hypothetical protein D9758_005338 [Tetrapyrgos nigripes]